MTIELDPDAVERAGRLLVADAADVAAAATRPAAPVTGHAQPRVATLITELADRSGGLAERAMSNGEGLAALTRSLLALDEAVGLGMRWR